MAGENEYDVYDEASTAASPKYFGASRRALATTSAAPAPSTPRRERTIQGIAAASPSLSVRTAIRAHDQLVGGQRQAGHRPLMHIGIKLALQGAQIAERLGPSLRPMPAIGNISFPARRSAPPWPQSTAAPGTPARHTRESARPP